MYENGTHMTGRNDGEMIPDPPDAWIEIPEITDEGGEVKVVIQIWRDADYAADYEVDISYDFEPNYTTLEGQVENMVEYDVFLPYEESGTITVEASGEVGAIDVSESATIQVGNGGGPGNGDGPGTGDGIDRKYMIAGGLLLAYAISQGN